MSIAAGGSWGNVYAHRAAASLAVAGGRSSQGGIGGLALGGSLHVIPSSKPCLQSHRSTFFLLKSKGFVGQFRARTRQGRHCQCKRGRARKPFDRLEGRLQQLWHRHSISYDDLRARQAMGRRRSLRYGSVLPASAGVSRLHHRRGCVRLCAPPSQRWLCCHVRWGDGKELGVLHKTSGVSAYASALSIDAAADRSTEDVAPRHFLRVC